MNRLPTAALDLIRHYETLRLVAYLCPTGVPTIGWGHTATVTRADVGKKRITEAEAEYLFKRDVGNAEAAVGALVDVPLTDGQYGALVSLVYNIGFGHFEESTLRRLLNLGDYRGAEQQFARWNKSNGKIQGGLVARRAAEVSLWNGGYDLP